MLISNFVTKYILFRIVFVQSRMDGNLPVPNRYFGVFENGSLKIRGIEARRHDTLHLFSKCQNEILEIIAKGNIISKVNALMSKVKDISYYYVHLLNLRTVRFEEFVFTKRLSKDSNEYESGNTADLLNNRYYVCIYIHIMIIVKDLSKIKLSCVLIP